MKNILIFLIIYMLFSGCGTLPKVSINKSTKTESFIEVEWKNSKRDVDIACKEHGYKHKSDSLNACAVIYENKCIIVAVEPKNFDDFMSLKHLGHETWHCFGADHY